MGAVRIFGLVFFMTILVGGCILAQTPAPQPDSVSQEWSEITWDSAMEYLHQGDVLLMTKSDLSLVLVLRDGSVLQSKFPSELELEEELVRCGEECADVYRLSV